MPANPTPPTTASALSGYWESKYERWLQEIKNWASGSSLTIPDGFSPGDTPASWAAVLTMKFNARVQRLSTSGDAIDSYYADATQAALNDWRQRGGPQQTSAFLQTRMALDSLIREGSGLDAVVSLQQEIQRVLSKANGEQDLPFPIPPPVENRARLDNVEPLDLARYIALQVVVAPFVARIPGQDQLLETSEDALSREVHHAGVVEALASTILSLPESYQGPGLSNLRSLVDAIWVVLMETPSFEPLRPGLRPYLITLSDQITGQQSPGDRVLDLPRALGKAQKKAEVTITQVGEALVVGAALLGTIGFFLGSSTKAPPKRPGGSTSPPTPIDMLGMLGKPSTSPAERSGKSGGEVDEDITPE